MDSQKAISFIENSFLKDYLSVDTITDISFNGNNLFYLDNISGRQQIDMHLETQTVKDFVRQIANLCEKQFSYQDPILDVSFGRYRFNATHQSIGRYFNDEVITFSIRITSTYLRISKNSSFLNPLVIELCEVLILSQVSVVIGGLTGSGKTEFQKFLISLMNKNSRSIIIDNVLEMNNLQQFEDLDITSWQVNEFNKVCSTQSLIKNALRCNPDWLIVAESRGNEMLDVLNSSLSGHPIITTIHALDIESMPSRMTQMVMMNEKKMSYDDVYNDISYHLRFYFYLKRDYNNGQVKRYVKEIGYLDKGKMISIYEFDKKDIFYKLPKSSYSLLNLNNVSSNFKKTFLENVR